MSNIKKTYYYAPTWDVPPDNPAGIVLGNLIISPKNVWPPLLPADKSARLPIDGILETTKGNGQWTREKERKGSVEIYAKFLEMLLGLGMDVGVSGNKLDAIDFSYDLMTTKEFWPSPEYVKERMEQPGVVEYLKGMMSIDREVFMIIGVKSVTGAVAKRTRDDRMALALDVGADVTAATGVPLAAGMAPSSSRRQTDVASWKVSDAFVFAFRVARIKPRKRGSGFGTHPFEKGAMHGVTERVDNKNVQTTFEIETLDDQTGLEVFDGQEGVIVSNANDFTFKSFSK